LFKEPFFAFRERIVCITAYIHFKMLPARVAKNVLCLSRSTFLLARTLATNASAPTSTKKKYVIAPSRVEDMDNPFIFSLSDWANPSLTKAEKIAREKEQNEKDDKEGWDPLSYGNSYIAALPILALASVIGNGIVNALTIPEPYKHYQYNWTTGDNPYFH